LAEFTNSGALLHWQCNPQSEYKAKVNMLWMIPEFVL